jgi:hypothetical protein
MKHIGCAVCIEGGETARIPSCDEAWDAKLESLAQTMDILIEAVSGDGLQTFPAHHPGERWILQEATENRAKRVDVLRGKDNSILTIFD